MLRRVLLFLFPAFLALGLAGCAALESAFPRTATGYRDGGIVGAVGGAASGAAALCAALDAAEVRALVDRSADGFDADDRLAAIRERRLAACAAAGVISALTAAVAPPPRREPGD